MNLPGFDPAGSPAAPEDVVRGFLDALGVPPGRISADPEVTNAWALLAAATEAAGQALGARLTALTGRRPPFLLPNRVSSLQLLG